ncbi:hypothetical protein B566_EDAN010164 [Ephemera danica]|nr:hypothetical protein B566_EDAN010164 [Ephemera danica]
MSGMSSDGRGEKLLRQHNYAPPRWVSSENAFSRTCKKLAFPHPTIRPALHHTTAVPHDFVLFHQFLCLRNIKTFLAICKDIFKIDESELFDPSELFDLSNFQNIPSTPEAPNAEEDESSNETESATDEVQSPSSWKSFPIKCPLPCDGAADEEAYEELCYVTFNIGEV